jgi:hypothetical protein
VKLYLSGQMTGLPEFNFPKFNYVANKIRSNHTYTIMNPAEEFEGRINLPRNIYMRKDIETLLTVDGIVMLDGWQHSKGARLELAIANELGLEIYRWDDEQEKLFPLTNDIKYELE